MRSHIINTPISKLEKGLSLIEVLVTITITSIGLMGLVSLQMQSVRATSDSGNRSQAVWIWNDIANRIHANEGASSNYINLSPVSCSLPSPICSSYHDGISAKIPANCSGAEQAQWDLFEVSCPLRPTPYLGDSNKYLPDFELDITCESANCNKDGNPVRITLQWRARSDDEVITGAVRTVDSGLLTITDVITP